MLKASLRRIWQRVSGSAIDDDLEPYNRRLAAVADAEARLRTMSQTQLEVEARRCLAELRASPDHRARIARADPLFAAVREAGRRLLGVRLFDEQVIAGMALAQGRVIEMQTGEGKTLAAVAAVMLFVAAGQGVHVWTFNDYLAQRDARWMAPIYRLFGLRTAWVTHHLTSAARREAYRADVTYSSAKEVGFDLLRDQLVTSTSERVLRRLHAVLVDEADSLLIDEARTPLVLAGGDEAVDLGLGRLLPLIEALQQGLHVDTDEHERNVYLTDAGTTRLEAELGRGCLHEQQNLQLLTLARRAPPRRGRAGLARSPGPNAVEAPAREPCGGGAGARPASSAAGPAGRRLGRAPGSCRRDQGGDPPPQHRRRQPAGLEGRAHRHFQRHAAAVPR
jgi:preprotein translocase subunit SecA